MAYVKFTLKRPRETTVKTEVSSTCLLEELELSEAQREVDEAPWFGSLPYRMASILGSAETKEPDLKWQRQRQRRNASIH